MPTSSSASSIVRDTTLSHPPMPRLPPSLLHSLSGTHTLLPLLLRETRDVPSARNELRWITQHVDELLPLPPHSPRLKRRRSNLLRQLCVRRGVWGEPLQYILGKEYFGSTGVEIDVGKGVLVPRFLPPPISSRDC